MTCEATFLDGPMQGHTATFDCGQPPPFCVIERQKIDSHASLDAPMEFEKIIYVRDINPFDEGVMWIYMLETAYKAKHCKPETPGA